MKKLDEKENNFCFSIKSSNEKIILTSLIILAICYFLPLLIANRLYVDDVARSLFGYTTWEPEGRPLLAFAVYLLNFSTTIYDIAPLTQICGIVVVCYALSRYGIIFEQTGNKWSIAILMAFLCNSFLLENYSFRFESIGFSICIAIPLLCFAYTRYEVNIRHKVIIVAITTACAIAIYQAIIGMFISLTIFEAFYKLVHKIKLKDIIISFIYEFAGIVLGCAIYFIYLSIFKILFVATYTASWAGEHGALISIFSKAGWMRVIESTIRYCGVFVRYALSLQPMALLWVSVLFMVCLVVLTKRQLTTGGGQSTRVMRCVLVLITPFLIAFASFAPLLMLDNPIVSPRVLMAVSVLFLLVLYVVASVMREYKYGILLILPFFIATFSFSYAYGNALSYQGRYDDNLCANITYDIEHHTDVASAKNIVTIGRQPYSRGMLHYAESRPLLFPLVPLYLDGGKFGHALLSYSLSEKLNLKLPDDESRQFVKNNVPAIDSKVYAIYQNGQDIILYFKPNDSIKQKDALFDDLRKKFSEMGLYKKR